MFSTVLGQVTGQLEKRFVLNALFPTLVFALALALAVSLGADGPGSAISGWEGDDAGIKVLIAIGGLGLVFLGANVVSNASQTVILVFEGYLPPVSCFAKPGRNRQLAIAGRLLEKSRSAPTGPERSAAIDAFQRRFPSYPPHLVAGDLAPTRLGNLLKSAETYAADRYGADAVRVWPRLYPLLPEAMSNSMAAARTSMEFLLTVSLLSALYVPLACLYMIAAGAPLLWILFSLGVASLISFATYFVSFGPTISYGEQLRAAFDLYRLELFKQMRVKMPKNLAEERQAWVDLILLLERGEPDPAWEYAEEPKK